MSAVILLWGESDYLLRLEAAAVFGDLKPVEVEASAWAAGATADLATPSLFGERRGLLVSGAQDLSSEAIAAIAAYAGDPAPDAMLVLIASVSARAKSAPAKLTKGLGKTAEARRVAVERKELAAWLMTRAKARGVAAEPKGLQTLVATLGEDPATLDQAVAQLGSAFPDEGITERTVRGQFRGSGDHRIYELCDAAFGRDLPTAHRYLRSMLEAREEPLAILGGIASRLRDLLRVRSLPQEMPLAEVARAAGLRFDWQARRYRDQAKRFRPEALTEIHAKLVEADRVLKSGGTGDVVLPMLVASIARG